MIDVCSVCHINVATFCLAQDVDHNDEQEDDNDIPPNIPPLPQSHLQALQNRTPDNKGNVAKIVSQFQEAATISNVNISFTVLFFRTSSQHYLVLYYLLMSYFMVILYVAVIDETHSYCRTTGHRN